MTSIIAIANQKGGVGKTTTCANLGIGLAQDGKRVLLIDADPQGSLSISLGYTQPDELGVTLSDIMEGIIEEQPLAPGEGILHHEENIDLLPANISLSGLEVSLVNAMNREKILKQYVDSYALACGIDDSEIRDYDLISARNSMIGRENFLVKLDNIPVGMVQYQITKSALDDANIVFVHSLYIFDEFQNKGIAYWLLRQLFLMYANHRIECECWYSIPAEVQYEKIGFRTLYSRLFINEEDLRLGPKLDV